MERLLKFRTHIYIAFLIIGVSFAALAANQFFINHIMSDWLFLYDAGFNILHNKTIAGQDFPGSPSYFPDLLIIMLIELFSRNFVLVHYIYSIIFLCAYLFFIRNLLILMHIKTRSEVLLGMIIAFACCFLMLLSFSFAWHIPFILNWSGSHLAIILFNLYLIYFYLSNPTFKLFSWNALILFTLSYLLYISDNLLLIQTIIPFALLVAFDCLIRKIKFSSAFAWMLIFSLVFVLGNNTTTLLENYFDVTFSLQSKNLFTLPSLEQIKADFTNLIDAYLFYFKVSTSICITIFANIILSLLCIASTILQQYQSRKKMEGYGNFLRIMAFFYLAIISNLFLAVLSGKIIETSYFRYLDTIYLLPPISLALTLAYMLKNKIDISMTQVLITILTIGYSITFIYFNYAPLRHFSLRKPYNETIQCIDNTALTYHLKNGLANYWIARVDKMLSRQDINIASLSPNANDKALFFFRGTDNKISYYSDPSKKIRLQYQFIIVNDMREELVEQSVGKPDKIILCGNEKLWLYLTKESEARFNLFWKDAPITI